MKKLIYLSLSAAVAASLLSACGDNKTKKKLIGSQMITSSSGSGTLSTTDGLSKAVSLSANTGAQACGKSKYVAAQARAASARGASGADLGSQDSEGFYTISNYGFTNTSVKIRFQDAAGNALAVGPALASYVRLRVKVTTVYAFGTFAGDFLIKPDTSTDTETMESGTITTADPVGGTFTATISNMVVERTSVNGTYIGLPVSGSMAISGTAGGFAYTGTNTYSKSGSTYKCEGPINVSGAKVADVYLTFSTTFGNYTGYWVNPADGSQHTIQ